jgi:hypothetical protein
MLKRMADANRLLRLLDGCPDGITERALVVMHQFAPSLLYRCIDLGLVNVRVEQVGARKGNGSLLTIYRLYLSEEGRKQLETGSDL